MKLLWRKVLTSITFDQSDFEELKAYAEQEFKFGSANDAKSLRSQLLSVERQTGKTPIELENLLELPEMSVLIWKYFLELNNSRQSGMGVNPISYSEMQAYFNLINVNPEIYEVEAIKMLDNVALKHYSDQQSKEESKTKTKK